MRAGTLKASILIIILFLCGCGAAAEEGVVWKHLSTANGDLGVPNAGAQQTATAVFDVDKDGVNDFLIAERTEAPAVVWYRRTADGWDKYTVEAEMLKIEAGAAWTDIDGDGDTDVVFGGDSQSNRVWWWENPCPDYDRSKGWKRHVIKDFGANKHHDQIFGDFDDDGQSELAFWNQGAAKLYIAEVPDDPKTADNWQCTEIYRYSTDGEMQQRGRYPGFKGVNEHEGLGKCDVDGDGREDIIAGGHWFKHVGEGDFTANTIDASYQFSRAAVGQLIKGGRCEVVLVVGDGVAPMMIYEWREGTWFGKVLIAEVDNGHSLDIIDFNGDGHLDIFNAEMRFGKGNADAHCRILLGDGKGNFEQVEIATGFGLHESRMVDLDGDGDYDVLGKPYSWNAPRLDIWINEGQAAK